MTVPASRQLIVHCEGPEPMQFRTLFDGAAPADHIALWVATLDELRPYSAEYTDSLDTAERDRMKRFRFDGDRERYVLGHGLLRQLLGTLVGRRAADLQFERGRYGKPFLIDTPITFNMSDTKDAVAIAVGTDRDLGVDIETMSRKVDHDAVGQHYFTPEEMASIGSSPDQKRRFLDYWTRKEAVLKASGVGIMDDLRVLRVDAPLNRMTITHAAFIAMAAPEYHLRTWHLGESHIISLASSREVGAIRFFSVA